MLALLAPLSAAAQENCTNGVDDNGNGLIDLNDPECQCTGFFQIDDAPSLIPNASFEQMNCCPSTYSQVNCATGWIQASEPTSDYMNTCGFVFGAATSAGLVPFPDGNGILGAIFSPGWQEYVGSCLSSTMTAGNNYKLAFYIASTPINGSGDVCNGGNIDYEPIDIVIYGSANCNALPVSTIGCPSNASASWSVLGSVTYTPVAAWEVITIEFVPAQNINAVIIGSPCTLPPNYITNACYPYFYFDNLVLFETTYYTTVTIDATGNYCSDNVVLTASADSAGGSWQWYLEGVALVGQTSPVLNVSANGFGVGNFQVRYTIGNDCELAEILLEQESVTADFSVAPVCLGTPTEFTDASTITNGTLTNWQWSFGDVGGNSAQQNPTYTYAAAGTYSATLTASLGICSHTMSTQVEVYHNPVADFRTAEVCLNDENFLEDRSTTLSGIINAWEWDLADLTQAVTQNVLHTYAASGTYNVELSVTSDLGCEGTVILPVVVHAPPVANFSIVQACVGFSTSFIDQSVHPDGLMQWLWAFGDSGTSVQQNPSHVYATAGSYGAELIAFTPFGCSDTIVKQLAVYAAPMAGFINDTVCAELVTTFTDISVVSVGTFVAWSWDFGDGSTSIQQHPAHVFLTGGTYTVRLTVTTDEGCSHFVQKNVIVHAKPVADFALTDECLNDVTQLVDGSTVSAGSSISKWDWDLGDNVGSSSAQDTIYSYLQSGTFTVTLMVETDNGCRDTASHMAQVFDLPVAMLTVTDVCLYDAAVYNNTSSIPSGSIVQHFWNRGDATLVQTQTPDPHVYPTHGVYDVQLITVSDHGCRDTVIRPVEIFPVPVANFSFDTVCFPTATQFENLSTIASGGVIDNWNWKFGDATMNTVDQHPSHNYAVWGDYQITLTVTSTDGCTHETVIGPARVHPRPAALFSGTIANCHQDSTYFQDLSTLANYPNDSIVEWTWQFGDGNVATFPDPAHLYADEGFHDATLAVMSNNGCVDTVTRSVEIYPLPRVAFVADTTRGCQPFRVQFMDQTTIPSPYGLESWQWDFGDGTDSVYGYYPVNTYHTDSLGPNDVALFTVSLVVTSARGCVSSATRPNYITEYPKPNAWFEVDPKRAELLFARMQVTDLSSPNVIDWDYDLGDGSWYSVPSPFHVYQDTGTFTITQYVATQYGCLDTAETIVIVDPEFYFYIPNTFTPNSDTHNQTFFGTGVGVASYQMIIFDRWGSHLFESGSMDLPWDGTKNGQQVQQGVYAYIFNIVDVKGDTHQYVGHVNLIR